jgi:hypothetical protein
MRIALMMEAVNTSETLVNLYEIAWRSKPESSHIRADNKFKID